MNRTQLFDALSNLPPAAFERLLIVVNMPRMNRTGAAATIGDQVSALLGWAESSIGPGVEAIARHLTELNHFEFDAYLRSLIATYEKWWEYYTLTDAVGRVEQPAPEKPSVFDFGLMVKTVVKETDSPGSDPRAEEREKTERLPVLEGIRKYADDHVLLVGRPGSGKSTALIRLLLEEAAHSSRSAERYTPNPSPTFGRGGSEKIPVLVELRYWQDSIEGLIQGFLQRHGMTLDSSTLSTLLGQGRFLLLIDGLNELPSESARAQLTAFRRNHPKVPMIFTTRDLGLGGDLGIEKKLEMQPLTEPQMKDFIRAYVPDQAEAMLRQLSDRLREFGQTPLLLWMLCEVFQQSPSRQMPTNLAEVFRIFAKGYEESAQRKHEVAVLKGDVKPLSDRRLWKEALKALAALMMQGETPVDFRVAIHRAEAERELGRIFANEKFPTRDILDDLLKYHLLQRSTTDQIGFRHQLIQEYYAAEYLLPKLPELSNERLKRDYLNLLKWAEAIALMLALVDDEAQSLRVVKLAINDVDLMLGAQLAGKVNLRFQKQSIELISGFTLPDWLKVKVLEATQTDEVIPELRKAIKSQDHHVSRSAEVALTKLGSQAAISELRQALEEVYPNEPFSVAAAVVDLGGNVLTEDLLRDLQDKNADVRKMVAQALGELGDETAIPELISTLNKDRDSSVRFSASVALGRLRSEAAIPELLKGLEDEELHWEAERVLQELGSEKAIRGLIKILDEHEDSAVRSRAVKVLGNLGGEEAISGLLKAFKDQDYHIRSGAERALEELKSETAIPELLKFLQDENLDVLRSAAHVLKTLGNETIIPELFKILKEKLSHGLFNTKGEIEISGLLVSLSNDARAISFSRKAEDARVSG
ncbi:NACHT domain-containing protein [Nodosilinea nodulosa]|uniref:NACHT domain-containing protein n=1 Tax=Nodosilinea nodulosa TaxID=416001 RepID=UPI0002D9CAE6|nr:HEAT repeat domain-containing protein [Nodosilinea nodulosa]